MKTDWLRLCRRIKYPFYFSAVAVGLALLWWPFATQAELDSWEKELRAHGVPAQAVIYKQVTKQRGRSSPSETMHVRYDFAGRERTGEIGCWEACLPADTPVRIWVNPDDPTDFVAEFGTLSGNRGRAQGVIGAGGLLVAVLSGATAIASCRADRHIRRAVSAGPGLRSNRQRATRLRRRSTRDGSAVRVRLPSGRRLRRKR